MSSLLYAEGKSRRSERPIVHLTPLTPCFLLTSPGGPKCGQAPRDHTQLAAAKTRECNVQRGQKHRRGLSEAPVRPSTLLCAVVAGVAVGGYRKTRRPKEPRHTDTSSTHTHTPTHVLLQGEPNERLRTVLYKHTPSDAPLLTSCCSPTYFPPTPPIRYSPLSSTDRLRPAASASDPSSSSLLDVPEGGALSFPIVSSTPWFRIVPFSPPPPSE